MDETTKDLGSGSLSKNPFIRGNAYTGTLDSNGIISIRANQVPTGVMVLGAPFLCAASIAYTRNGITTIRITRQFEFLEEINVTAAQTSIDFKAKLTGDFDYEYKLESRWEKPSENNSNLLLRINETSSLTGADSEIAGGTAALTTDLTVGVGRRNKEATHSMTTLIEAKSGVTRKLFTHDTSDEPDVYIIGGSYTDSDVRIKTLGLEGAIGAGSKFTLYRKPQLNNTTLTLWVY